jgi:uncharacterized small protein (TIGR04563 family)
MSTSTSGDACLVTWWRRNSKLQRKGEKMTEKATDKRKQSLYFPEEMLTEIKKEAVRQDRSLSWIVQQAWRISREEIRKFPSINLESDDE